MTAKIFLLDDHEVVRSGLRHMLDSTEFKVVDESNSAAKLVATVEKTSADILILDVVFGTGNVFNQLERVRISRPDLPVVLYSAFENPSYVRRAVDLQAAAYVLKSATSDQLLEVLRKVVRDGNAWDGGELRRISGAFASPRLDVENEVPLTRRESEVLTHMVCGLTNKEIALELKISYETVKEHVQHVFRKLGVSDRTQAAVWAVRRGLA